MAENKNVVLKKARKELDYLTGDAAVRRMAELREKWEMDEIAVKKHAERIGREEGRIEGNVEGRMAEKKETARKLLLKNMKIEEIIEITGLTEEEIKEIKN